MADKEAEPSKDAGQPKLLTHQPHSERWPSADYAYTDGYQHGYYAGQQSTTIKDEETTMDGINSDKVSINLGGEGGGSGAGAMAALVAALGNRNQGNDNAALIAALGGRNESRSDVGLLAALMNGRDRHDDGGMNSMWPILLLALLGRRGGFGGGDDGGEVERPVFNAAVLSKLGSIEGAIPTSGLQTENAICRSTGEINNAINQSQLASLAAFSNLKDSVTSTGTVLLQSGSQNTKEILGAICAIGSKMDQNQIADLNRQLAVAQLDSVESRLRNHSDSIESRVSQNVSVQTNQLQAQSQYQRFEDERFNRLYGIVANIGNQVQRSRSDQDIVNLGTMLASGTQTPTTTQVR
jgi:hypothetical protein